MLQKISRGLQEVQSAGPLKSCVVGRVISSALRISLPAKSTMSRCEWRVRLDAWHWLPERVDRIQPAGVEVADKRVRKLFRRARRARAGACNYTVNLAGQLTTATNGTSTANYGYDCNGNRITTSTGSTTTNDL